MKDKIGLFLLESHVNELDQIVAELQAFANNIVSQCLNLWIVFGPANFLLEGVDLSGQRSTELVARFIPLTSRRSSQPQS